MTVPFKISKAWAAQIAKAPKISRRDALPPHQLRAIQDAEGVEHIMDWVFKPWLRQGKAARAALAAKLADDNADGMRTLSWMNGDFCDIAREKVARKIMHAVGDIKEPARVAAILRLAIAGAREQVMNVQYPAHSGTGCTLLADTAERAAWGEFLRQAQYTSLYKEECE